VTGVRHDEGSAVVEFLGVALVLLVPLTYLVLVVGRLQAATFAAEGAAREAARVFVASDEPADGASRALAAAGVAFADQGLRDDPATAVSIACSAACLTPGSEVTVDVQVDVPLPFVPAFVRGAVPLEIPVTARRTAVVDEYREAP
jgi:Na+-transporting methylmalonyl-CoA/oxaloacetate decarboxylase gamma subunit